MRSIWPSGCWQAAGRCRRPGLGARDLLRIEAGLCLYGNELSELISPVEAGLAWSISPRRRRQGGFIGAEPVQEALAGGSRRQLVGLTVQGRLPLRGGAELRSASGSPAGAVTSGSWSPVLQMPVALAFVELEHAAPGTQLEASLRQRPVQATVASLPHVAPRYRIRPRQAAPVT